MKEKLCDEINNITILENVSNSERSVEAQLAVEKAISQLTSLRKKTKGAESIVYARLVSNLVGDKKDFIRAISKEMP